MLSKLKGYQAAIAAQVHPRKREAGLTLVECIVAIVVVGLVGAAIAPAMVVSVATRVQSQRAEQALQLAQAQVDRTRAFAERGALAYLNDIPTATASSPVAVAGPTSLVGLAANAYYTDSPTKAFETTLNGTRFGVQAFKAYVQTQSINGTNQLVGFKFGVRVYDARAFQGASGPLSKEKASLGLTAGEGDRLSQPLAVLYSDILLAEQGQTLCTYTSAANRGCPSP